MDVMEPWNAWFSFLNQYICFEEFPTELPMTTVRMAVAALLHWREFGSIGVNYLFSI